MKQKTGKLLAERERERETEMENKEKKERAGNIILKINQFSTLRQNYNFTSEDCGDIVSLTFTGIPF